MKTTHEITKKIPKSMKSATMYTICVIFSRGLSIITIPIFTRIMSTEQIGLVSLYNSWNAIITIFTTLSLTSGGFSIALKDFSKERDEYISSVLFLTTCISIIVAVAYLIMPGYWERLTGIPNKLIILMILGFFLTPAREFWLARQRYEYKYKLSSIVIIGSALLSTIISIMVVYFNKDNQAYNRILSTCAITYIISLAIYIQEFIKGKTAINAHYWKYSLRLSLPLVGHSLASQVLNASDRIMIGKMIGNSALGIYGTIYTISSISTMVWSALNASYVPILYRNINKNNKSIRKSSLILLSLFSVITIVCIYFAPEIVKIITTPDYYDAIYIMPPIAAGVYFISISNMYSNIFIYLKKTKYIMYSSTFAAIFNLTLNYIYINKYGYIAAAYTTLITYIIMAILLAIFANKMFYKYENKKLNEVYNNKSILMLSLSIIALSMAAIVLYNLTVVRYVVVVLLIIIAAIIFTKNRTKLIKGIIKK